MDASVKRGDIFYADLSPVVGSEQGGVRPVLIVQNDVGNRFSPTVIAAAITSQTDKTKLPTHITLPSVNCGLHKDSVVLLEHKNKRKGKDLERTFACGDLWQYVCFHCRYCMARLPGAQLAALSLFVHILVHHACHGVQSV